MKNLSVFVHQDNITKDLSNCFDFEFNGETSFLPPKFEMPKEFQIGLIVGQSGSGKTTILKSIGDEINHTWDDSKAICSHFKNSEDAKTRLGAVGLNSVPVWMKPYKVLSNGEKFRADLAMKLHDNSLVDEFTSVVDRNVAKSCSYAIQRYIRENGIKNMIFASCHYDIIEWLQPDWVFDANTGIMTGRGSERRPKIIITLIPCVTAAWSLFSNHHYLTGNINKSARCWIAEWNGVPVGFASIISYPSGTVKNAWRGHRTVILPEFQGMGLGVRISDAVGMMVKKSGGRYFSKTANYRMGEYRNRSNLWRPTSKNMKSRPDYAAKRQTKESSYKHKHINRICYSHEFIGKDEA